MAVFSRVHTRNLSPPHILAGGFLMVIMLGTVLLSLPVSQASAIAFNDVLFTAVSAVTVTGLVVVSTGHDFTMFGQVIIMIMIKTGGLGLMTFAIMTIMVLGKRIGLKERLIMSEAFGQRQLGGIVRLVKILFVFSVVMELTATAILALRWVPEFGWGFGLFTSLFHAISAFNNAGFSLWDDSLMGFVGDPVVNILITFLFITGGIGFTVIYDLMTTKRFRQYALHTKVMLIGTLVINVVAVLVIFLLEMSNPSTIGDLNTYEQLFASYFQAVTPRTAGFNSVEIGDLRTPTVLFMMLLMFIGGGSASTASGIKLTTFIIIVYAVITFLKGKKDIHILERKVSEDIIMKALAIFVISGSAVFIGIFILSISEPDAGLVMIAFEVFSAFGTVGLSMGLTGELSAVGQYLVMVLMFIGRLGPLTLAFTLATRDNRSISYPKEDVFTG